MAVSDNVFELYSCYVAAADCDLDASKDGCAGKTSYHAFRLAIFHIELHFKDKCSVIQNAQG
jgi:hypothetical protein